jgi:hypothetical protein
LLDILFLSVSAVLAGSKTINMVEPEGTSGRKHPGKESNTDKTSQILSEVTSFAGLVMLPLIRQQSFKDREFNAISQLKNEVLC